MEVEKLDNPIWYSLTEIHKDFAIDYNGIKFYHPDYCPFGGFITPDKTEIGIKLYGSLTNNFYVVGNKPNFNYKVQLHKELVCNQMLLDKQIDMEISEQIVELQTINQKFDLFNLVNLVQPGYFKSKTSDLGSYYGIYKDDKLIAVTGERMKMNGYTEISAVVTHPEHIGKGYAKQLIAYTSHKIFSEGKIAYLHVADTNIEAIRLYEKLGFWTRRKISFWNLITNYNK
ncbi:MAG: GNAT family N-acetyltransferase [Flavobacterium sp.]